MAALSQEVAVIPVIAKSDCMTASELTAFKSEVVQRLQFPGLEGGCFSFTCRTHQDTRCSLAVQCCPAELCKWPLKLLLSEVKAHPACKHASRDDAASWPL